MTVYFVVIVLGFASGVHLVGSFHYGYHLNNQTGTTNSKVVFYLWLGLISFENLVFTGNQSIKYFVAIPSLISCSWHITIWLIFFILIIRPLLSWESTSHQYAPICEVIEFIDTLFLLLSTNYAFLKCWKLLFTKWKQIRRRLVICGLRAESHFGVCVKERSELEHCQISSSFIDHPWYQLKDHGPELSLYEA